MQFFLSPADNLKCSYGIEKCTACTFNLQPLRIKSPKLLGGLFLFVHYYACIGFQIVDFKFDNTVAIRKRNDRFFP